MNTTTLIILILIGLSAGVLSGFVGIGGGVLMVPAMIYFLGLGQHESQGTSLAVMLPPIGVLAAYNYYKAGELNWKYAAVIALFFIVGGYFGSKFALVLDAKLLKKIFGIGLLLVAIKMIIGK